MLKMTERFSEKWSEEEAEYYARWHSRTHRWGKRLFGYEAEGDEYVPDEGRGMLVFGHLGGLDTLAAAGAVKNRRVVAIGRRKMMEKPIVGGFFKRWDARTIDRPRDVSDPRAAAREAIRIMKEPLEEDLLELVFGMPDTRKPGIKPSFPVAGVARVAYETGSRVSPGAIKGTDHKIGNLIFRELRAKIGPSIAPPDGPSPRERKEWSHHLWELGTELHDSIDSRFTYVDIDRETGLPVSDPQRWQLLKLLLYLNSQKPN